MKTPITQPAGNPPTNIASRPAHTGGARMAVTNAIVLGEQLANALGAARTLIDRTASDPAVMVEQLRRWYYAQHPEERDRRLWLRFTEATQTHARLEHAIDAAREALETERHALTEAQDERKVLASRPLPATVAEEATGKHPEAVHHYQSLVAECQQREAAITELERLLPAPEQTMGQLAEATAQVLEAVATVACEAFVQRLSESGEMAHLRSRFQWLRAAANAHAAEIEEWSQRTGRPLRVPRIAFPWPPAPVWKALLDTPAEGPKLVWADDPETPSV